MDKWVIDRTSATKDDAVALGLKVLEKEFPGKFIVRQASFCDRLLCRQPLRLRDKFASGNDIKYYRKKENWGPYNPYNIMTTDKLKVKVETRKTLNEAKLKNSASELYYVNILDDRLVMPNKEPLDAKPNKKTLCCQNVCGGIRFYAIDLFLYRFLFEPLVAAIWLGALAVMASNFWKDNEIDLDISIQEVMYKLLQSLLIFKLCFDLQSGFSRNKEMKQLYEALTGDVKAMAMYFETLTYDQQKYYKKGKEIKLKDDVANQYRRVSMLLGAIPSTAMFVLRGEYFWCCFKKKRTIQFEKGAQIPFSKDRKPRKRCVNRYSNKRCYRCDFGVFNCWKTVEVDEDWFLFGMLMEVDIDKISDRDWFDKDGKKIKKLWKESMGIRRSLYNKLKFLRQSTDMDLFECEMTMLLDEMTRCAENGLGFGNSSVQKTFYTKWQDIYGSWGKMSSVKTFREPAILITFKIFIFILYAITMPYMYRGSHYDTVFVVLDIFVLAGLWVVAYYIRNPFKARLGSSGVSNIARGASNQISRLMYGKTHEILETTEYREDGFLKTVYPVALKFEDDYEHVDSNQIYPVQSTYEKIKNAKDKMDYIDKELSTGDLELSLDFIQKVGRIEGVNKDKLYEKYLERHPENVRNAFAFGACPGVRQNKSGNTSALYFHMRNNKFEDQLFHYDGTNIKKKSKRTSGNWMTIDYNINDCVCFSRENLLKITPDLREKPTDLIWIKMKEFLDDLGELKPDNTKWSTFLRNYDTVERLDKVRNSFTDTLIF